jgi:tetratricopeptide (TPR) repeat protein
VLLGNLYVGPRVTFGDARRCAERALEIAGDLQGGHTFLGAVYLFHDWNWAAAERELKHGAGADAHPSALTLYGFCLAATGRLSEARDAIRRCQELDPARAAHRNELAMVYNWMRQHDRAIVEAENALELDSAFPLAYAELGIAYVRQGRPEEAIARLERAIALGQQHPNVHGALGSALAAAGRRADALEVVERLAALAPGRYGFAPPIARILAALGETERACAWLTKACDERSPFVIWIKVDPTVDPLRSDPRFGQILQDMGLPP